MTSKTTQNQDFVKTLAAGAGMTLLWALFPCAVSLYLLYSSDASAARMIGAALVSAVFGFAMAVKTGHFDFGRYPSRKNA